MVVNELKTLAENKGDKLTAVSVQRIKTLQKDLQKFQEETELNGFQQYIVNKLYRFQMIPEQMKLIIVVAVSRPAYAKVKFIADGKEYNVFSTVAANTDRAERYMRAVMKKEGYRIDKESRLPLKRIAVQSGLAEYGRNNIAYVEGMGSCFALMAFSTEMPCENDTWREPVISSKCDACSICIKNCPTNAINESRFLIDNEKCLSAINENTDDFPVWLPTNVHHTPYDCLMCQAGCPMNENQEVIEVSFTQEETKRILEGAPYKNTAKELKKKIDMLGLDWWSSIPRNLQVLFDAMDNGHIPKL
ncbi:MAG: 4Fe-4S binding protein [Defluviitaleaceae bacterium]|nr:4Fe-4S binding protein [Defluviitaleaceae bacterium]